VSKGGQQLKADARLRTTACILHLPKIELLATCLGCLSGRIAEKPLVNEKPDGGLSRHSFSDGGGGQLSLREPAGKELPWWAQEPDLLYCSGN